MVRKYQTGLKIVGLCLLGISVSASAEEVSGAPSDGTSEYRSMGSTQTDTGQRMEQFRQRLNAASANQGGAQDRQMRNQWKKMHTTRTREQNDGESNLGVSLGAQKGNRTKGR
jgi:hypothetical protein